MADVSEHGQGGAKPAEDARQGITTGTVRWVLIIGIILAILGLLAAHRFAA